MYIDRVKPLITPCFTRVVIKDGDVTQIRVGYHNTKRKTHITVFANFVNGELVEVKMPQLEDPGMKKEVRRVRLRNGEPHPSEYDPFADEEPGEEWVEQLVEIWAYEKRDPGVFYSGPPIRCSEWTIAEWDRLMRMTLVVLFPFKCHPKVAPRLASSVFSWRRSADDLAKWFKQEAAWHMKLDEMPWASRFYGHFHKLAEIHRLDMKRIMGLSHKEISKVILDGLHGGEKADRGGLLYILTHYMKYRRSLGSKRIHPWADVTKEQARRVRAGTEAATVAMFLEVINDGLRADRREALRQIAFRNIPAFTRAVREDIKRRHNGPGRPYQQGNLQAEAFRFLCDYLNQLEHGVDAQLGMATLFQRSHDWHLNMEHEDAFHNHRRLPLHTPIPLHPVFEEEVPLGKGFILKHLATVKDILDEGAAMHHCVGGYVTGALDGRAHLFAIRKRSKKKETRVSTVEFVLISVCHSLAVANFGDPIYRPDGFVFDPEENTEVRIRQNYGPYNHSPGEEVEKLLRDYVSKLNQKLKVK